MFANPSDVAVIHQGRTQQIGAEEGRVKMAMIQIPKSIMDDILEKDTLINERLVQVELTKCSITLTLLFSLIPALTRTHKHTHTGAAHHRQHAI